MSKKTKTKPMFSLKDKQPKVEEQLRSVEEITAEYSKLCQDYGNRCIQHEIEKSMILARYQELNNEMQLTQSVMKAAAAQKAAEPVETLPAEEAVSEEAV